jgi:3-hydroxyisobutyrate dehydrogenase-like beta-hydroxyacid dehydrogenase
MNEQIAFLGTGRLGAAFVEAACGRGDRVTVWNRTADKAKALESFGATAAATPAEAVANAERVHLVLKDDATVESVIAELRGALRPRAVIIDHTTTLPAETAERSKRLNAEGVPYLHCPVFIGPPAARAGKGTIMAAGPMALFNTVQPALALQAERVEYLGERPDMAAIIKLSGNLLIIGNCALIADMLTMTSKAGITPAETLRLFDFFNPVVGAVARGKAMAAHDWSANFELTMARKDVRLMLEAAGDGVLAALPGIAARMDALIAAGHGADDMGVIGIDAVR